MVPHSNMRRTIARRLVESKSTVPHFYLSVDCRMERLLALRAEINAAASRKISVNDFIVRAADSKTLSQISQEIADLAARARAGQLRPEEYQGGSMSVSNLGMYGVGEFAAIINPPQAAILAVGASQQQPVVDNGELKVGTVMRCTLSVDHRAIDGALAAQWLAAFQRAIEAPLSMLV